LVLLDKLRIGDLNRTRGIDATDYVLKYERKLIAHSRKRYGRLVKWKDKTRLKGIMSVHGLKKMWKFFGTLFTKFKDKMKFIEREEDRLVDQALQKGSTKSWTRWMAQFPYTEHTVDISFQKGMDHQLNCFQEPKKERYSWP
jgi:hypothetical protein